MKKPEMLALKLPVISIRTALYIALALVFAALLSVVATPRLTAIENAPSLEDTVPRAFGDWRELPSPLVQVSLSTGTEPNMQQPYDQTVMRAYQNSKGQVVYLALAWGRQQRQEVKVHRPDLCYIAQGYKVRSLTSHSFEGISAQEGGAVTGKQMVALAGRGGEAVSYWMRIGTLYSEDAVDTRLHILKDGLAGRIPDGILVRASARISDIGDAAGVWPTLNKFLVDLVAATPAQTRTLLVK